MKTVSINLSLTQIFKKLISTTYREITHSNTQLQQQLSLRGHVTFREF